MFGPGAHAIALEDAEWMALRRDAVEESIGEEGSDEYKQNHHANLA